MLTKNQKSSLIEQTEKRLRESSAAVFAEFHGLTVGDISSLKKELKKVDADFKVVKKRLLDIVLKKAGISFDARATKEQLGTVFSRGDLVSVAPIVYKFLKAITKAKKGNYAILGAYDFSDRRFIDPNEFKAIATLPPREVLLAQIAMMLTMPIKKLMLALNERSKQIQSEAQIAERIA